MTFEQPITLEQAKALHVQKTLNACDGNLSKAAKVLGINRRTLSRSVARWRIERNANAVEHPPQTCADASRAHVTQILGEMGWNITETAKALQVDRRTLYRLLERWGVSRPEPSCAQS